MSGGHAYDTWRNSVWRHVLAQIHARTRPHVVLLHGAELIGDNKPDWTMQAKAPPSEHNDAMLAAPPISAIVFPGTDIQANLAEGARASQTSARASPREMAIGACSTSCGLATYWRFVDLTACGAITTTSATQCSAPAKRRDCSNHDQRLNLRRLADGPHTEIDPRCSAGVRERDWARPKPWPRGSPSRPVSRTRTTERGVYLRRKLSASREQLARVLDLMVKDSAIAKATQVGLDRLASGRIPRRPKRHRHATCPWAATQWTA
jgi:hypothetical protein